MPKSSVNPKTESFFKQADNWHDELATLRTILLGCDLTEEIKWGKPCYTLDGKNLLILIPLKETCALMFCQGALLKDSKKVLLKVGENTQAGRWIKFTSVAEIKKLTPTLKAYIREAIDAQKAGLKVALKPHTDYKVPAELQNRLDHNPALKKAFAALTPGRQRAYYLHISSAKQAATREARIDKCTPDILRGKGWNER